MSLEARRFGGQLDPRLRGRKTHICVSCDFPIATYGRCAPCLHVYCLTCAAGMVQCLICRARITKLERIPAKAGLFISPLTLQGYRTEADLAKHAHQLDLQLRQLMGAASAGMPSGVRLLAPMQAGHPGWKPPPPPLPRQQLGMGRPQQYQPHYQAQSQQQQLWPRHGTGAVMMPL